MMNELPLSRVFGSLDPNSLSIASPNNSTSSINTEKIRSINNSSSSSGGGGMNVYNSFGQLPSDENQMPLLSWRTEKREFMFESNSTPTKDGKRQLSLVPTGGRGEGEGERGRTVHSKKRKSQLIGAKPRIPTKLSIVENSRLDLLEEDKMTSLPIVAPPLTQNKRMRLNPVNELRVHNNMRSRHVSYGPLEQCQNDNFNSIEDEGVRRDGDVDYQPIVMVEDYISSNGEEESEDSFHFSKKRVSISNLRLKMSKQQGKGQGQEEGEERYNKGKLSLPLKFKRMKKRANDGKSVVKGINVLLLPQVMGEGFFEELKEEEEEVEWREDEEEDKHKLQMMRSIHDLVGNQDRLLKDPYSSISEDKYIEQEMNKRRGNIRLEKEIFHEYDGDRYSIKRCVICEKPLYEISSLLSSDSRLHDYREIVCESCTIKYEETAKLFEEFEFETTNEEGSMDSRDSMMSGLELPVERFESDGGGHMKFSNELIRSLNDNLRVNGEEGNAHEANTFDTKTNIQWFIEAREKIRHFLFKYKDGTL